jgi:hypothetical protein
MIVKMKHWKRIGMALLLCLLFAVLAGCNEEEAVSSGSDLSVPEENSAATSSRELLQGTSSGEEASLPEESQPEESQPEESQPEESQPEESQPDGNESIDDAELEYLCVYGSFLSGTLEEEVTVQYAEKDGECIFSVPSWEKKYLLPCQTILCGDILGDSAWAITYEGGEKLTVFRATRENQSVEQFEISVGVSLKQPHLLLEVVDETVPTDGAEYLAREMSARGELYRRLLPAMSEGTPESRAGAAKLFRIAYAALAGKDPLKL